MPDFEVRAFEVAHKGGRTFGYTVRHGGGSMGYIPDHAPELGVSADALEALAGVDALVHDAQFLEHERPRAVDYGHATVDDALRLADRVGAASLVLFHHSPHRVDDALDTIGPTRPRRPRFPSSSPPRDRPWTSRERRRWTGPSLRSPAPCPRVVQVRILSVSDLHYRLPHYDWLVKAAQDPAIDVVVLAGDLADVVSPVPIDVQAVVLDSYLRTLSEHALVLASSGNHDLDGPGGNGEQVAGWLRRVKAERVLVDGASTDVDGVRLHRVPLVGRSCHPRRGGRPAGRCRRRPS